MSWRWFSRGLPVVVALLAACQPVPQPFLSADPVRDHPLSRPVGQAGVLVRPVAGTPDPAAFATAMATALQRLDIAAGTQSANRASLWLSARVKATPDAGSAHYLNLRLHWFVRDQRGTLRGDHVATAHVTAGAWERADPDLLVRLAHENAAAVAPLLSDNARVKTVPPPLVVHEVLGAPGDGADSLRSALANALRRRGYTITDTITARTIVLSAVVRLTPRGKAGDDIAIAWTALAPDGALLGVVQQANRVPSGSLSGAWGRSAAQAATAAVPGIIELLGRARRLIPKT